MFEDHVETLQISLHMKCGNRGNSYLTPLQSFTSLIESGICNRRRQTENQPKDIDVFASRDLHQVPA